MTNLHTYSILFIAFLPPTHIFPCKNDRTIALPVHHTVFPNVSGSIVKYNVDNNPKGNMDGIHPCANSNAQHSLGMLYCAGVPLGKWC